jgi:hypothetical protein
MHGGHHIRILCVERDLLKLTSEVMAQEEPKMTRRGASREKKEKMSI